MTTHLWLGSTWEYRWTAEVLSISVAANVHQSVLFNFCRCDANDIPIAWGIDVVDVFALNFIWAHDRPPDVLRNETHHCFGDRLGDSERAAFTVGQGLDKF